MDILLEGDADGVEAAQAITKLYALPVVFLTAHADDATVRRAEATEPFGYVLKPFDERELTLTIEIALFRSRSEAKLRAVNQQLQAALDQVKTLQALLPICSSCKKVRALDGYWERVENYLMAHSEVEFTHGICPDCLKKGALTKKSVRHEAS
jgi:CheY-like chemotaxis protein